MRPVSSARSSSARPAPAAQVAVKAVMQSGCTPDPVDLSPTWTGEHHFTRFFSMCADRLLSDAKMRRLSSSSERSWKP